jgi:hypothetical protein
MTLHHQSYGALNSEFERRNAVGPTADFVAEDSQRRSPIEADRSGRNHTPLGRGMIERRTHLDHEAAFGARTSRREWYRSRLLRCVVMAATASNVFPLHRTQRPRTPSGSQ